MSTESSIDPRLQTTEGVRVVSYTTADGERHPYRVRVRVVSDTLLHFFAYEERPRATEAPVVSGDSAAVFMLPKTEIHQLEYEGKASKLPVYVFAGVVLAAMSYFIYLSIAFSPGIY